MAPSENEFDTPGLWAPRICFPQLDPAPTGPCLHEAAACGAPAASPFIQLMGRNRHLEVVFS